MAKRKQSITNATLRNPVEEWLRDAFVMMPSTAGETVVPRDMYAYPPAWSCINKIAGHVGYLPLNLYERDRSDERRKKLAESHPAYWLLKHQPNPIMSPMVFRQALQSATLVHGNGRAYIKRNMRGEPAELWPLPPHRTSTILVMIDGSTAGVEDVTRGKIVQKWHLLRDDTGQPIPIPDRDVLHIAGLGDDGIQGYSVIELAKEWLGLAKAQNRAVGGNFKNGARPSFMLKAPPGVFKTQEEAKAWLTNFRKQHEGADNEGKVGLLTGGIEAQVLQISARDSQWQEQRNFSRQDAAIWFGVEQMLGDDSSVSYNSLEEKNRAYVTNCLMRWLTAWEQECWLKLLTTAQRESMRYYFRFVTAALLRGSLADRYNAYMIGRQGEWLSVNDVRESEDMDAIDGGDDYRNPSINPKPNDDEEPPAEPDDVRDKLTRVVRTRLQEQQAVELNRVQSAARNAGNFCEWVERFYEADGFSDRVATTFQHCGLEAVDARTYCDESKRQLLDAAGTCTQNDLSRTVECIIAAWPDRLVPLVITATRSE